jgi:hypothetical protein
MGLEDSTVMEDAMTTPTTPTIPHPPPRMYRQGQPMEVDS